jgi:hypothetical protein
MRESRLSGSVEGVVCKHDSYSDFLPCIALGRDDDEAQVCRALERDPPCVTVAIHGRCRAKKAQITAGPFGSLGAGPNNRG